MIIGIETFWIESTAARTMRLSPMFPCATRALAFSPARSCSRIEIERVMIGSEIVVLGGAVIACLGRFEHGAYRIPLSATLLSPGVDLVIYFRNPDTNPHLISASCEVMR